MKDYVLLIDMDEVLCDFIGGACEACNVPREYMELKRVPGEWEITRSLGLTLSEFWSRIDGRGPQFWYNLKLFEWTRELLKFADNTFGDNWFLCSTPGMDSDLKWSKYSYMGKLNWIQSKLGKDFERFHLTFHKHMLAQPKVILLDDRERNVENFREKGGLGVVFPSKGNSLHRFKDDPLAYVQQAIQSVDSSFR